MELHGKNIIAGEPSSEGDFVFEAFDPRNSKTLEPAFYESTSAEIDRALRVAEESFGEYRKLPPETRAQFLEEVANEVEALGSDLIERAMAETGLPEGRLVGERGRTVNQLRMFAQVVREGSWVEARIDRAIPDRTPIPKPDIRRMLVPIGPCAVFGASNFPLAFSAAGGDSASALAAGCPVVLKAHPSHPGTSELVSRAFGKAVEKLGIPPGVFSTVHGKNPGVSLELVKHPLTQAVGFTGSLRAGRALFDAAASRLQPIPVYAEMGSTNPVFLLPGSETEETARGFFQSLTLGVGQFCTNPGLLFGIESPTFSSFLETLGSLVSDSKPGTLLHAGILHAFEEGVYRMETTPGVERLAQSQTPPDPLKTEAAAVVFVTDLKTFLENPLLSEEVFGPSTLIIRCKNQEEMLEAASRIQGNLTATVHGSEEALSEQSHLISILQRKVGRLVFNGFPTGVEVCPSMQHGGPYPATTDPRVTSVGTAAIVRFARPVCYQNAPEEVLPDELKNANPRGIWRLVDNQFTKEAIQ